MPQAESNISFNSESRAEYRPLKYPDHPAPILVSSGKNNFLPERELVAPADEKKFILPEEDQNIKKLRQTLDRMESIPLQSVSPVVSEQNIQLEQLRARMEELKRKRILLADTKSRLERQIPGLKAEISTQRGYANAESNLRPIL